MTGCCSQHKGIYEIRFIDVVCNDGTISDSCHNATSVNSLVFFASLIFLIIFLALYWLKEDKIEKQKQKKYDELTKAIKELKKQGLKGEEIARKLKYYRSNIYKKLKKGGDK